MGRAELISRLRAFAGAALVERGGACFLVDPKWGACERAQWSALSEQAPVDAGGDVGGRGWLCIPTGGSSGAMKLARHDEHTLGAAVAGFCTHFDVRRVDAVGLLPVWHVSGLMAWARSVWTGGVYHVVEWKDVESGAMRPEAKGSFVSLVPTQLARLLGDAAAEAWLRGFRAVLLGGGPVWPQLITQARAAGLPVSLSYGMTETAAMVAAQRPQEFLAGDDSCGRALPHIRLEQDADGRIVAAGASAFYGYWPEVRAPGPWRTDDLGSFDPAGRLRIIGRADALIITGGKKVNPMEVERALRMVGGAALTDVAVVGVPHPTWGCEVVALYLATEAMTPAAESTLREALAGVLAPAKRPKRYIAVAAARWPRDKQGKVSRTALEALVEFAAMTVC